MAITQSDSERGLFVKSGSIDNTINLMQKWLDDPSDYDTKVWAQIKKELNQDRLADRVLFRG